MRLTLTILNGPHKGLAFSMTRPETFLVGRSRNAHFHIPVAEKSLSRLHFMIEVTRTGCELIDLSSRNGTTINGQRALTMSLKTGDQIKAGKFVFAVDFEMHDDEETVSLRGVKQE